MRISFAVVVKPILIDGPAAYSVAPGTVAFAGSTIMGCGGLFGTRGDGIFELDCFAGSAFFAGDVEAGRGRGR